MKRILSLIAISLLSPIAIANGNYGGVTMANVAYHTNHSMEIEVQFCALSSYPLTNCSAPFIFNHPNPLKVGESTTFSSNLDFPQGDIIAILRVILHDANGKIISETRFNEPYNVTICAAKTRESGKALDNRVILFNEINFNKKASVVCDPNAVSETYSRNLNQMYYGKSREILE